MALRLEDKQAIVAEVSEIAGQSLSAVVADYRGLTVADMTQLRSKARQANVYLRVIRNTLAKRAFNDTNFACMNEILVGPMIFAFSKEEPGAAARLIRDFAKEYKTLEVKALSIDGQLLEAGDLTKIAELPTKDEAISMLMSVMTAPISKFVRTLAEPHTQMVRAFDAVRSQKEQAA